MLTTPQLITLTRRPARTIDYRLARLRERSLVDRTRPYAASDSAPCDWWLTRAGAHLVEGSSPAPGKGTLNPLFLRHTAAIAGFFVALFDAGPTVGLTLTEWRRDEGAWEDWSGYRGTGRIRPDAYAEVHLDIDGHDGVAGAFVEVDFATMDQARLRTKVSRHRSYCKETVWWDRHPCWPALLLVTTSEEAVVAPVWRQAVGDAPAITLSALLAPDVRQYRRVVARVQEAQHHHDEYRRRQLVHDLNRDAPALADDIGDEEATTMIRYFFAGSLNVHNPRERWGLDHLDLVEQTASW